MTARRPADSRPGMGALPGPWADRAACRDTDVPDAWHPSDGGAKAATEAAHAVAVCKVCPVKSPCLEFALSLTPTETLGGIYGGTTYDQRKNYWRKRKAA